MAKNKNKIYILISWTALIFWVVLIFNLSSQPAVRSNGLSKRVTKVVVETVERVSTKANVNMGRANHLLRKNAHFFAYLILGILVINIMRVMGVSGFKAFYLALGICVLYAISDEFHQLFVPGRGGQVKDILIDSTGAIVGIGIYLVCNHHLCS